MDYPIIEWFELQMLEHCKTIINGARHGIHKIRLDSGEDVYCVPEAVYQAAKEKFKEAKKNHEEL